MTEQFKWDEEDYIEHEGSDDDEDPGPGVLTAEEIQEVLKSLRSREAYVFEEFETKAPYRIGQPMCPACGRSIFECYVHDEDDLEVIRRHDEGNHYACDSDACAEGEDGPLV